VPCPALATCLRTHRSAIVDSWIVRVQGARLGHYHDRPRAELESWGNQLVEAIAVSAEAGRDADLDAYVAGLTRDRYQLGFALDEVLEAGLLVKEAILPFLLRHVPDVEPAVASLDEKVRAIAVRFASGFVLVMRDQQERVAALEERHRLARDLHDSVSQALFGVGMYAEAAARLVASGEADRAAEHLVQLRSTAHEALREMRRMIYDLRPANLQEQGLAAALRERLAAVEMRVGVDTELDDALPGRLPRFTEDAVYGVAVEALNNAMRHARAGRVSVRLRADGHHAELEVEDNGRGFDVGAVAGQGGLGLRGMRERTARLGGELAIRSTPDGGTLVLARFPLQDASSSAD
jgi:signal transduction histidine kinase